MSETRSLIDFGLIDRIRVDRIGVENGLADIAQFCIDRMRKRVDDRWLMITHNDDARAAVALKVLYQHGYTKLAVRQPKFPA